MGETGYVVVLITAGSPAEAEQIARGLVEARLAACVNIIPRVDSLFHWQGKLDTAAESLLIVKGRAARLDDIIALVKARHSYQVPEIITLPIAGGHPAYLDWLGRETAE
ncbi:MAG: divalent-cation tolerance protein CutA [Chloroflexota bacterium]